MGAHALQQIEGAYDVGVDELARAADGAVYVALGCKVEDGAGLVRSQQLADQGRVAKVALNKDVLGVTGDRRQVLQIAGVGQLVQVDDSFVRLG